MRKIIQQNLCIRLKNTIFAPTIVLWCNGSTTVFGSVSGGSNPPGTTKSIGFTNKLCAKYSVKSSVFLLRNYINKKDSLNVTPYFLLLVIKAH